MMVESYYLSKFACYLVVGRYNGYDTFIKIYGCTNDQLWQCEIATSKIEWQGHVTLVRPDEKVDNCNIAD